MGFTYYENRVLPDEWTVSFDKVPEEAGRSNGVHRIQKGWDKVKSDADGLVGLKLQKPDFDALYTALVKHKSHAVVFELVLTKSELRLDIEAGSITIKAGKVSVPSDREGYRAFLANLSGWSDGDHNLVPDADFKKFKNDNPKPPTKYKDFEEMVKKSKSDTDDFRAWAKSNSGAKKALDAYDKVAKLKPADPARAAAIKAMNQPLQDYYKSFD